MNVIYNKYNIKETDDLNFDKFKLIANSELQF